MSTVMKGHVDTGGGSGGECRRGLRSALSAAASPLRVAFCTMAACLLTQSVALAGQVGSLFEDPCVITGMNEIRHSNHQPFVAFRLRSTLNYHRISPYGQCAVAGHGSHYAGIGLLYEVPFHGFWLTVGSGPGLYRHKQNDPDLGYGVEFASWIELSSTVFRRRVGVSLTHVSNAHLGRSNPGTEAVGVVLHF